MLPHAILFPSAVVITAAGAWTDLRTGHIPNALTLGGLALALFERCFLGYVLGVGPVVTLWMIGGALLGALGCAMLPVLLYFFGGMGGGDVKLFAALGAFLGLVPSLRAEAYSFVAAMVLAIFVALRRGVLHTVLGNTWALVRGESEPPPDRAGFTEMRFAPAIFAGTCLVIWQSWSGT